MLKQLTLVTLFIGLSACKDLQRPDPYHIDDEGWETRSFEWDPEKYEVVCDGQSIDPIEFLDQLHAEMKIREWVDNQYFYDFMDLRNPTHVGHRRDKERQYLRYDFLRDMEGSYVPGAVVLGVEACDREFGYIRMTTGEF